jgi:hypothetical protein
MTPSRWPWLMASVLLLFGAVAGGGAVREHWLDCRGSMLSGSVLRAYAYGPDFSEACLRTMDNGGFAFLWPDGRKPRGTESVLGMTGALLLALSWVVVMATAGWSRCTRVVAGVPAALTTGVALGNLLPGSSDASDSGFSWLLVAVNVSAVVAFVVIAAQERLGGRALWRVAFVLGGSTAVGFFPMLADYAFMVAFSDANWDAPPGNGYPTVVAVALSGVAVLAMTLRDRIPPRPAAGEAIRSDSRLDSPAAHS